MRRFFRIQLPKKWKLFHFEKRKKFVIVTAFLTLGLIATQLVSFNQRSQMVLLLAGAAYFLSVFALWEGLGGVEWVTSLILPSLYTASVALFYFLLPVRWLTRLPTALFYAIGMYALLLTENIFNVAAARSIQLVRAAHSIGLLLTLVTSFLFFNTIFALRLNTIGIALLSVIITFPIAFQSLWSATHERKRIALTIWLYTIAISLIIGEVASFLSFWPLKGNIAALYLTAILYTLLGLGQQRLMERLFPAIRRELILVSIIVLILVFFTTQWGGR